MDVVTHSLVGVCVALVLVKTDKFDSDMYVFLISLFGSNFPDTDVLTILTGKTNYLRVHRTLTHTKTVVFMISLIFGVFFALISGESFWWTFGLILATSLIHIGLDSLNSYGVKLTQKGKWVRMGILTTVDVFLIALLIIFIVVDSVYSSPLYLFIVYILILLYILLRVVIYFSISNYIKRRFIDYVSFALFSAINSFKYEAILEYSNCYKVINFHINKVTIIEKEKKVIDAKYRSLVEDRKTFSAFTDLSPYYYERQYESSKFVKLKFTDLRYHRKNKYFYFNLVYIIDKTTLEIIKEDVGFSTNGKVMKKKLWI